MKTFDEWWEQANTRLTDLPKEQARYIWNQAQLHELGYSFFGYLHDGTVLRDEGEIADHFDGALYNKSEFTPLFTAEQDDSIWRMSLVSAARDIVAADRKNTGAEPSVSALAKAIGDLQDILDEADLPCHPRNDPKWRMLAAVLYQVCGAFGAPGRVMDLLSAAQRGEQFNHLLEGILPVVPVVRDEDRPLECVSCDDRLATEAGIRAISDQFRDALKGLAFAARTTGGGPDQQLIAACEQAERALSLGGAGKAFMDAANSAQQDNLPNWQPIDTAPKDGTAILAVKSGYEPSVVQWVPSYELAMWDADNDGAGKWFVDPEVFSEEEHFQQAFDESKYEPTHWVPLPKSPCNPPSSDSDDYLEIPAFLRRGGADD